MFGWDVLPARGTCKSIEVPFGGLIWMQRFSIIGSEAPSLSLQKVQGLAIPGMQGWERQPMVVKCAMRKRKIGYVL